MSDTVAVQPHRECEGLMFIGDPHISSEKPGRRLDKDYAATILGKLKFAIDLCNEKNYVPVFLGDMYDKAVEVEKSLEVRTLRLLQTSRNLPIGNVGNHDITHKVLTDDDSLKFLQQAGAIRLCTESGVLETFLIGGKTVSVGATPYGQSFPSDARFYFPKSDTIIWLTHHDLAFDGAYPGAVEPHEIKGCRLAINGHMHLNKPMVRKGETTWFNPGNITRQAVDAIEHVPSVRVLTAAGKLERVIIPHQKGVFDLTGKLIDSISPGEVAKEGVETEGGPISESAFVSLLQASTSMEMPKSANGSILMEDIQAKFERDQTNTVVQSIVLSVLERALEAA